ncbi:hypothetical protein PSA5_21155 [Pseudomonas syringae pv. actinidiae]|nr:hypothetical protein PSA5_21155 [Pseudomonas syringae pv. actinidiae]
MGAIPVSYPPRRKADLGRPEGQGPFGPSGADGIVSTGFSRRGLTSQKLIGSVFECGPICWI